MIFTGIGSAFNIKLGNTSAYTKCGKELILFDCGSTVFKTLNENKILEDINRIVVVITHTHSDHVGSLGDLIFYAYYVMKVKVELLFPDAAYIRRYLRMIGVEETVYTLYSDRIKRFEEGCFAGMEISFVKTEHIKLLPSFGFVVSYKDEVFYYSGDAVMISEDIISKFMGNEIHRLYQDVSGKDIKGNLHMPLNVLKEMIPKAMRHRVFCMHFENDQVIEEARLAGFGVVEAMVEM